KLQRSVTETRRSRTIRPKLSTIWRSGTGDLPGVTRIHLISLILRNPDPAAAVGPALLLPDRHGPLQLIDQVAAAGERLRPVGSCGGDDDARFPRRHDAG